jgi:hypothetical protein
MLSSNLWDVSHLMHEERLLQAQHNLLVRQLAPGASALQRARKILSRMLFFL